jgi:hypothetical protein
MTEELFPPPPGAEQRIAEAVARMTYGDDAGKISGPRPPRLSAPPLGQDMLLLPRGQAPLGVQP